MSLERSTLDRKVEPEVRAAALLARECALRDESGEQVRRRPKPAETGRVANETAVLPEPVAELGGYGRLDR